MNCTKIRGLTDVPGQSLANVLEDHFQLEQSVSMIAVTSQMELDVKNRLSTPKTSNQLVARVEKRDDEEKVANAGFKMEMKDVCTIQNQKESLGKTSDIDQKKISTGQFAMQAEVGTGSSCDDLLSMKTEDVHYLQHNPRYILAEAANPCHYQQLLSSLENSSITKPIKLGKAESLSSYNEARYLVSSDARDLATCSQYAQKPIVQEQLKAFSVPRVPMFLWQYLNPALLNTSVPPWSAEFVQDKGWHRSLPGSFTWCQSCAELPLSFAAIDVLSKTGTSNCLVAKTSTTPPVPYYEHPVKGCAKLAAEDAVKTAAAMPCLVSSRSASGLAAGSPPQLGSIFHDTQLYMTPVPSAYGTRSLDFQVSKQRQPSSENVFRSLSV